MTLKTLILAGTTPVCEILNEETAKAYVEYILNRYINKSRLPRIEAIRKSKDPKNRRLSDDNVNPITKAEFRQTAISYFDSKSKTTKMPKDDFIIILDLYLKNFSSSGELLPADS